MDLIKRLFSTLARLVRFLAKDPAVAGITMFLVGSVAATVWWQGVAVVGLALLLFALARRLLQLRRAQELTVFEHSLRQPDPDATARLRSENEHFLVFNKVIEVRAHPNLGSRTNLYGLGWSPENIPVAFDHVQFDATAILAQTGGLAEFDPPNGRKFCLVDRPLLGTDTDLALHLKETNYFTIRSVIRELPFSRRREFGSLDPRKNHIPHSLCLHFVVRLADGSVICLRNEARKVYAQDTWSISAEEQIKEDDLQGKSPLQSLFRRAVLEEIFGLSDDRVPVNERWRSIADEVRCIRIWSLFVEEHLNNFCLLGFCQLNCDPAGLKAAIQRLANEGIGVRDLEGKLFTTSRTGLERLLMMGNCTAKGLFSEDKELLAEEQLHWTSRYRAFRLLRALNGGPLVPPRDVAAFRGA